ncbi:MAG: hypothetical protein MK207_15320 [Saprospiraceae bacterium]|nr:hypothetical protein [Saprospiraceae bacterium]
MYRALFFLAVTAFIFIAHPSVLSLNANNSSKTVKTPRTISDLNAEEKAAFIKHVIETGDCEWNGIKLYGKVEFVTSFPDIKIEYVTSFSDINVKFVSSFPDDCGEWQEVSSFPDFKVQVVTSFPDLKVKKVTSFPGMN